MSSMAAWYYDYQEKLLYLWPVQVPTDEDPAGPFSGLIRGSARISSCKSSGRLTKTSVAPTSKKIRLAKPSVCWGQHPGHKTLSGRNASFQGILRLIKSHSDRWPAETVRYLKSACDLSTTSGQRKEIVRLLPNAIRGHKSD